MTQRTIDPRTARAFILAAVIIASFLAIFYLGRGTYHLILKGGRPTDLFLRWRELRYVAGGQNPYDISEYVYDREFGMPPASPNSRPVKIDPVYGATWVCSGYPPWAFFWSTIFIPPISWPMARIWFFLTNIIALALLVAFAWRASPSDLFSHRLLLMLTVLAASPLGGTLVNGQWGLILCAILIVCVSRKEGLGRIPLGILYAITLLKPNFSFAHAGIFFNRRFFLALVIAFIATVAAAMIVGWHVATSPVVMVKQMLLQTARWKDNSYSIPDALIFFGLPRSIAFFGCLGFATILSILLVQGSRTTAMFEMAVCSTLARLFTYHQSYDNILIVFLAIALGQLFLKRSTIGNAAIFAVFLITLWLPLRLANLVIVQSLHLVVWSIGLAWLVYFTRCSKEAGTQAMIAREA
jgi:hypothetical protein